MNKKTKNLIVALIWATAITLLCALGVFRSPELWLEDMLYQKPVYIPDDICLIGITEDDIKEFGPYYSWDRTVMARALEALNKDPAKKPAVVAIDIQYSGRMDEEGDKRLAKAAEDLGNVITATTATFGQKRTFGSATVVIDDFSILDYEEPYEELRDVTTQGSINIMYDMDGIARHYFLYVEPEGKRVYSMPYQAASLYAKSKGTTIRMPETDERGHFYVSFSGKPGDFYEGLTLSQLINGKVDPKFYAGKIVLIGPYTTGLQDSYITPIEKSSMMYGIEVQANVVQCLLDGNYKHKATDYYQIGILWIVCFAFYVFANNRKLRFTIPVLIAGVGLAVGVSIWMFSLGIIVHALWVPLGLLVLFVATVAENYIRAAIERQNVTRTFERYVAPNVVGEILKEGTENLKLGGKTVDIAVLFVDIRGFTTMSERLSPEEVVFILNRYLSMTSACVERYQGTLDKFIGDATMAFWGAPLADDEAIYHAAMAALDIVKGAEELSAKLKEEIHEEIHVGVGVNYGPAVVGNMGSERRMDYTAIGDTVNTSARLEANAPGGTVYISRSVADALKGRMKFEPLEKPIKLKGKADGFEILRLIGPEDNA
ncbi:MAG: adenylate/guanylate cyclase domain-containing protein [Ruminococcaceae bacterium]|nr:adenylate/guanylate cyclase domain-containing protein [Oscillospiraceae bacterium]